MKASVTPYQSSRRKLYAAGVFALALLMLVVTCPLKRMVQGHHTVSTSAQKFHRATVQQSAAIEYTATASCCALKERAQVIQGSTVKLGVSSPNSIMPFLTIVQGFGIHYFLSRVDQGFPSFTTAASLSLPLFLQHLRLRI